MKQIGKKIKRGLVCAAMVCALPIAALANSEGIQQPGYLRGSDDMWANSQVNLPNNLSVYGEGDIFTQKPCVVEKIAPFLGDENNLEVTLRFEDGTTVVLRQDFAPAVTEGQELSANALVGSYEDKGLCLAKHISVSAQQNGENLTTKEICEKGIIITAIA